MQVYFEIGPSGARRASERQDVCIIVDVLRASSSIIAALMAGFNRIIVSNDFIPTHHYQAKAGEKNGMKAEGCDFGNSPIELMNAQYFQTELIFSSTNGVPCIHACDQNDSPVLIGAIINATAVSKKAKLFAQRHHKNISIILAGCQGILEEDDLLAGSIIYEKLKLPLGSLPSLSLMKTNQPWYTLLQSAAGKRLCQLGYEADIEFCARLDMTIIVPEYRHQIITRGVL